MAACRWENWTPGSYQVTGSVYRGKLQEPKTEASGAAISVIRQLASVWALHHERMGSPKTGWMFASARETTPVSLDNVANRQIKPALEAAKLPWYGWHAFRRGLATNLKALGIDDHTIKDILRHSHVSVTQACYIKAVPEKSVQAMDRLDAEITRTVAGTQPSGTLIQ